MHTSLRLTHQKQTKRKIWTEYFGFANLRNDIVCVNTEHWTLEQQNECNENQYAAAMKFECISVENHLNVISVCEHSKKK